MSSTLRVVSLECFYVPHQIISGSEPLATYPMATELKVPTSFHREAAWLYR